MSINKIKYLYLEMILVSKDDNHKVVSGLFKGIIERTGDKFVLMSGLEKDQTHVVNLRFYSFMTIESLDNEFRNMTFLTSEMSDQETALKIVTDHYTQLKEAGFCIQSDEGIIDVTKYVDVPKEYTGTVETIKGTVTKPSTVGNFANSGVSHARPSYSNNYSPNTYTKPTEKKEPTPTAFKRTDKKKLTPEWLASLHEKLDAIKAGDYIPNIPDIGGDYTVVAPTSKSYDDEGQGFMSKSFAERHAYSNFYGD